MYVDWTADCLTAQLASLNRGHFFMRNQIVKQVAVTVVAGVITALIVRKFMAPKPTAQSKPGMMA